MHRPDGTGAMAEPHIYLDNACTSFPKAPGVAQAIDTFIRTSAFNPSRSGYAPAQSTTRMMTQLRSALARMLGSPSSDRIILTSGATHALNIALLGVLERRRSTVPRVVTTSMGHNATVRPLARLADLELVELVEVRADTQGRIDADELLQEVDERCALVCMTHASNACGTIQPVAEVGRAIRARGLDTLLLVDGAQTVGVLDIDVQRDGIDLLAFSGHKALRGATGIGGLYVSRRAFDHEGDPDRQPLRPVLTGGAGDASHTPAMPGALPARFEPGTPNTLGACALLAAVRATSPEQRARDLAHERALIERFREQVRDVPGLRLIGPDDPHLGTGVQSIVMEGLSPHEMAAILDQQYRICARAGLHCAPKAHETLGTLDTGGTLRLSPGPTTREDEIDAAAKALCEIGVGV